MTTTTLLHDRETEQRAAWLAERRTGIGASDAPIVLGLSPWKSPLALYAEKAGLVNPSAGEQESARWGRKLEPVLAAAYEEETGRTTWDPGPYTIQRHTSIPWLLSTCDRFVAAIGHVNPWGYPETTPGVLELKTASALKKAAWTDEPPVMYQVQVQHQLAVTGHLWGSIAVLIGGQTFLWTDIQRNETFIAQLLAAEEAFWTRIQQRTPPEPDGSPSSAAILALLYPQEAQDHVVLPADALAIDHDRQRAAEIIRVQEEIKAECDNRLKALIGPHAVGILPNGTSYSWTMRKAYTATVKETRVLRRREAKG